MKVTARNMCPIVDTVFKGTSMRNNGKIKLLTSSCSHFGQFNNFSDGSVIYSFYYKRLYPVIDDVNVAMVGFFIFLRNGRCFFL